MIGRGKDPLKVKRVNKINNILKSIDFQKVVKKDLTENQVEYAKYKLVKYLKNVLSKIDPSKKTVTLNDILKLV